MGQNISQPESESLPIDLNFLHTANLSYLGEVQVMQEPKSKSIVISKEYYFNTQDDYDHELHRLKEAKTRNHKSFIEIYDVKGLSSVKLCSSSFKIILVAEYLKKTIASEIDSKRKQKEKFTIKEIIAFLKQGNEVINYAKRTGQKLGNLKSSLIWITNNDEFKFAENWMLRSIPIYTQCLSGNTERGVYLAPELLNNLKEKDCYPIFNYEKADIFTLGCIGCEMANMSELNAAFNFKSCSFNETLLDKALDDIYRNHGTQLFEILKAMTLVNVKTRLDSRKLKEMLNENDKKIVTETKIPNNPGKENIDKIMIQFESKKSGDESILDSVRSFKQSDVEDFRKLTDLILHDNSTDHSNLVQMDLKQPKTLNFFKEKENPFTEDSNLSKRSLQFFDSPKSNQKLSYSDGSEYIGEVYNGYRHGRGVFNFTDGGKYDGEWFYNKMHGFGCLYYPSCKLAYEGSWKDGRLDGHGTLYNEHSRPCLILKEEVIKNFDNLDDEWKSYSGSFLNDCKQGKGSLQFTNDDVFEGEFFEDYIHGWGVIKRNGKEYVSGKWIYNKLML